METYNHIEWRLFNFQVQTRGLPILAIVKAKSKPLFCRFLNNWKASCQSIASLKYQIGRTQSLSRMAILRNASFNKIYWPFIKNNFDQIIFNIEWWSRVWCRLFTVIIRHSGLLLHRTSERWPWKIVAPEIFKEKISQKFLLIALNF